jgi:hypothetical protein
MLRAVLTEADESISRLGLGIVVSIMMPGALTLLFARACWIEATGRILIAENIGPEALTSIAYRILLLSAIAAGAICGTLRIGPRIVWPGLAVPVTVYAVSYGVPDCCFALPSPLVILVFGMAGTLLGWSLVSRRAWWDIRAQNAISALQKRGAGRKAAAVLAGIGVEAVVLLLSVIVFTIFQNPEARSVDAVGVAVTLVGTFIAAYAGGVISALIERSWPSFIWIALGVWWPAAMLVAGVLSFRSPAATATVIVFTTIGLAGAYVGRAQRLKKSAGPPREHGALFSLRNSRIVSLSFFVLGSLNALAVIAIAVYLDYSTLQSGQAELITASAAMIPFWTSVVTVAGSALAANRRAVKLGFSALLVAYGVVVGYL